MLAIEFPGHTRLIAALDDAVRRDNAADITQVLCDNLCALIHDPQVQLPDCVFETSCDHYCRRELYRSADLGYSVIAMTWGPGQGTPIHDHAGMWCVEGVWHGPLEITPYDLLEHDAARNRFRFESCGTIHVGPGSTGRLIPPHEYHTIRNPDAKSTSVTLHVYRGPMLACSVFRPAEAGWHERAQRDLSLDAT